MKILLTGSSGFIGRNLKEAYQDRYDLYTPSHRDLDLLDEEAIMEYLRLNRFDVVIHTANTNEVVRPELAPQILDRNLRMFCNLFRCRDQFGKMLYFGSGAEYDKAHYISEMPESYFGTHIPTDPYGFSKYIMSELTGKTNNIYDLRLFGVFGRHEEWRRRFISNMIYQASVSDELRMDRNMYFDYLYVDDLAVILEWFISHEPKYQHYNVCSGQPVTLLSLAEIVKEEMASDARIIKAGEDWKSAYTGDNTRLITEYGELSLTPMREAIREMIAFYRENGFH